MSLSENSLSSVLCDVITEIIMCFGYNTQNEMYNLRDRLNDIAIGQYNCENVQNPFNDKPSIIQLRRLICRHTFGVLIFVSFSN